ncbi:GNAT family N-acetyltransferase [Tabrizicola sp.]|uniref:GNAT family N-acetyltransferase n=1 Tax=Tabrizicola sp. TaxID=2005166 RepID=UPI002FDD9B8C
MFDAGDLGAFLPLQQSAAYAAAVAACGARVRWLEGGVLAVERGRLRLVSRGTGLDRAGVRRLARWPGVTLVTPEDGVAGFGLVPLVTPMHHAVWALGPDLRAGMARNWRGHLRQAERAGLRVRRGDAATLEALIRREAVQRAERRYRALPEGFTRALPSGALRLWDWRQAGAVQAAMCFVVHETSASYHLSWGSDAARSAGVHQLMLTRAAEALWAEGVRWLDLGSVDSDRAPGLARFKLGTGAQLRRLGATCLVLP